MLFDDAHAGEQYVGEQYGVHIKRHDLPAIYEALLSAVSPALDGMLLQRLRDYPRIRACITRFGW